VDDPGVKEVMPVTIRKITKETGEAAILGGAVLGGGGGGSMDKGRMNVLGALEAGEVTLVDIDDVSPDTVLVTGSAVGAPAAKEASVEPRDYVRVVEILMENGCPKPGGFIPNECGGSSITNGWVPAALMGIPVIDALCNGRAHPTGVMGSMGLHRDPSYVSRQAAAGGSREKGLYIEMHAAGRLESASSLVRSAAEKSGGLVAVARNPVTADFTKKNGACGALQQAIDLGMKMKQAMGGGGSAVLEAVLGFLGGDHIVTGRVSAREILTRGGFDSGSIAVGDFETTFWNEYMTLERDGKRIATFPDLIMTLDAGTGMPVTTAEVSEGQEVILFVVPSECLILGEGMRCMELLETVEPVVGKKIVEYRK
jgi:DUF917 family protein